MSKLRRNFKKIASALCLGVVFLLSGLFFAACGEPAASSLTLSASQTSVSLYRGETENLTFTIGNYQDSIDGSLSFSLVDSTSATSSSEHVALRVLSQEGATTTVQLTGLSGGSTTLVAMTNEGAKTCSVQIEVLQYSSSVSLKSDLSLYVSQNHDFAPNSAMFDFEDNSTEKDLTFHFASSVEDIGDHNRFSTVSMEESGTLHFFYENGEENTEIEATSMAYDGQSFSAFARYNFYEYVDGVREQRTIAVPFSFCALQGMAENALKVTGAEGDIVSFVVNGQSTSDYQKTLTVTVPYSAINPSLSASLANSYIAVSYQVENSAVLSVEKQNETYSTEDATISFDLVLTSSTMVSQETSLTITAYYLVDGQSFEGGGSSVSKTKTITVDLNVAPINLTVNGLTDSSTSKPTYKLYNCYYGAAGYEQLYLNVYEPKSDYTGVQVSFDPTQVRLTHMGEALIDGDIISKEDISQPVLLRGAANAEVSTEVGNITFTVVSDYLETEISYTANYTISAGATELEFTNPNFEYQSTNQNSGVFLSSTADTQTFSYLQADQPFENVTLRFIEGDAAALGASFAGAGEGTGGSYPVLLQLTPRSVGTATYSVTLDNGVAKRVTFRVIDTFDDLSIALDSTSQGVQSFESIESADYDAAMRIILQNDGASYSSRAVVGFVSNLASSPFTNITYTSSNPTLTSISGSGSTYTIAANSYGAANVTFTVSGVSVQGFSRIPNSEKTALIELVSFVPVSSFNMTNTQTNSNSTTIDLFVGNSVTNTSLQTVTFVEQVLPQVAYGFYDPINDKYTNTQYSPSYIYWTVANADIFQQNGTGWESVDRITYNATSSNNIYRIGESANDYYGTFDSETKTFAINRDRTGEFSITLYATLRQYGTARYFAVTINGTEYDNVQRIYSNFGQNTITFSASAQDQRFDFGVYVSPFTAIDTDITVRYISTNTGDLSSLIIDLADGDPGDGIVTTERSKGIYLISVRLNSAVFSDPSGGTYSGRLEIIPNSWMSGGAVLPTYQNSILSFEVRYQNGTKANPFVLDSAQDILAIDNNAVSMASHYKLSTTIDVSTIANQLPLGKGLGEGGSDLAFTGSIVGKNDARITGINITNGSSANYGLFAMLGAGASIEGITFEGSFNIASAPSGANIGLIAGKSNAALEEGENNATLENVSARISASSIVAAGGANIGGLVGTNSGSITNPNVLFEGILDIKALDSAEVNAGGIAGTNSGNITGHNAEEYGYAAYSVYALIRITDLPSFDENTFNSTNLCGITGAVAAVSTDGDISGILAGGEVWAASAGGLVGDMQDGTLLSSTTRTFVRGTTIGLIVSKFSTTDIGATSTTGDVDQTITVEAVDDGQHLSENASMGIWYSEERLDALNFKLNLSEKYTLNFNKIFLGTGLSTTTTPENYLNEDSAFSYVARELVSPAIGATSIVINELDLLQYYGDFIVVNDTDIPTIINRATFTQRLTSFSVAANAASSFAQLHMEDCPLYDDSDTTDPCACDNIVYFAYYFEAAGYYSGEQFITGNLSAAQTQLDTLNRLSPDDALYPLSITGDSVVLTSNSPNIEISADGEIYIKGVGVAEIEVSNLLNQNQRQVIYLNVINYFNYHAYQAGLEAGLFKVGNMVLGGSTRLNVFSQRGVNVDVAPIYSLDRNTFGGSGSLAYGLDTDTRFNITSTGEVSLGSWVIQLAPSTDFALDIGFGTAGSDGLEYGNYAVTNQGVRFTKKPSVALPKNATDEISLSANISAGVEGATYKLPVTTLDRIMLNYSEGSSDILSNFDSYSLNSSNEINDQVEIVSDYSSDTLVVEIYNDQNQLIDRYDTGETIKSDTGAISIKSQEAQATALGIADRHLFDITASDSDSDLIYNVSITVDRDSPAFANRYAFDIYTNYTVVYYANSNGDEIKKEIPMNLRRESVDVIVATNYPRLSDLSQESENVIPGVTGLLSVSISPVDGDFDSILIQNAEINSGEGAAEADFIAGRLSIEENGDIEFEEKIPFSVAERGIRISRAALETGGSFNGQIYIRYTFSNNAVIDGTPVAITITAEQQPQNYSVTYDYTLFREESVSIHIDGYPYKTQVARGVEYRLAVTNDGYDSSTLQVVSSDPAIGMIEQREDDYYLVMTNSEISDYAEKGGKNFTLTVSASRENEFGEIINETSSLNLTMLEYVINYLPGQNQDIIAGMNNGVITSAVGERTQLELNFDDMIEYNPANQSVLTNINVFLESLKNNGTWTFYTDLNSNTAEGVQIHPIPLTTASATSSRLSTNSSITTPYLSTSGLSFSTFIAHNPESRHYFFTYSGQYAIERGRYVWTSRVSDEYPNGYTNLDTTFDVYSFLRGSEESPNPVTTYEEFANMTAGGHYILLNDIVVPSEDFQPLNRAVASFDGNNHYIIFDSPVYQLGSDSAAGLFGTVSASTFIKNIKVRIGSATTTSVTFNSSSSTSAEIGVIAGVNNGTISNAQIEMADGARLFVTFDSDPSTNGFYFGGIVGQNSGFLTNSTSKVNAQSLITMGGVVGQNSGVVASSAFKEGNLTSTSIYLTSHSTGGFAGENTLNGRILTSFTSGYVSGERPYSNETENGRISMITSSVSAASFVFNNEGEISDCYSNLPIQSDGMSAGFAFNNSGSIVRSFSTSKIIRDASAMDYNFASDNVIGTFEDCYYITGDINNSLLTPSLEGVEALEYSTDSDPVNEFDASYLAEKFSSYGYSSTPSYNSVWFYSSGETSNLFNGAQFAGGRLELVAANIVSTAQRINTGTTTSPDGVITYHYQTAPNSPADGSVFNPYVIHSPETMESYMTSPNNVLTGYYRLACDIDYSSLSADYSNLHNKIVQGNFDGNGMNISGIRITSTETLSYAGLFSEIGGSSTNFASVLNLTITPRLVTFANANAVGSLAGRVRNANIFNISVRGSTGDDDSDTTEEIVTVSGKNAVGGVIGLTAEGYNIKNLNVFTGAFASYVPSDDNPNDFESNTLDRTSFAGGIIGYVGGRGSVSDLQVSRGAVNIFADKAGIGFGGIASQASVDDVALTINAGMVIRAHSYGGIMVGELKGRLSNAYVYGSGDSFEIFNLRSYVATAVGGIAGVASDRASLDYVYMGQSFSIGNQTQASVSVSTVSYVGGIIGMVSSGYVSVGHAIVQADLTARNILGGVIGEVSASATAGLGSVTVSEAAVKEGVLRVEGQNSAPFVGGIIGRLSSNETSSAAVSISNSYVRADIELDAYTYSTSLTANVGAIVGGTESSNLTLNTIYSTTRYNINILDNSYPGTVQQVVRQTEMNASTGSQTYKPNQYVYASDQERQIQGFTYGNNVATSSAQVINVFNSAIWNFDDSNATSNYPYDYLNLGFTTITMLKDFEVGSVNFAVHQNEYGTNVPEANGGEAVNDTNILDRLDMTVYHGLFTTMTGSDINSYAGSGEGFTSDELKALAAFLGVSVGDDSINWVINPSAFTNKSNYMFVGFSDSRDGTRTLNFVQVTDRVWSASATDFSTLVFEEGMKI